MKFVHWWRRAKARRLCVIYNKHCWLCMDIALTWATKIQLHYRHALWASVSTCLCKVKEIWHFSFIWLRPRSFYIAHSRTGFSPSLTLSAEKFHWLISQHWLTFWSFHMQNGILRHQISMCTRQFLVIEVFFKLLQGSRPKSVNNLYSWRREAMEKNIWCLSIS